MLRTTALLIGALATVAFVPAHSPARIDTLTITVEDIRNDRGVIAAALFDEAAAERFPNAEPAFGTSVAAGATGVVITFENVAAGRYAVALIHDENENGELDTNEFGIPSEGFGFSNDVMGVMGPPSFGRAALDIEGASETSISMRYMGGD